MKSCKRLLVGRSGRGGVANQSEKMLLFDANTKV